MKKYNPTPLADEHLESIQQIKEAETDPFFYTRLKARMENETGEWSFPLKPIWVVSMLFIFLFINTFFLVTQSSGNKEMTTSGSSVQNFANEYDLTVSTF